MRELDEYQDSILNDLIKSKGWELYVLLVKEMADIMRKKATQKEEIVAYPDMAIWNAAEAQGMEAAILLLDKYLT